MTLKKILCFAAFLSYCLPSLAQLGRASVVGFVHNQQNEPLTAVSVRFPELGKSTQTDDNGRFEFSNLPTGIFTVFISQIGTDSLKTRIEVKEQNHPFYFKLNSGITLLDQVSVFGYTANQEANRQAYHITALDAKKFQNTTLDIARVLDKVPGARLRESGGMGSDFDFSINGFSGKRIRFFLDGVPMDDFGSAFQINNIPINFVDRIEVYKGVVPVWLGSDALGGAVNLISDRNMKNYLDVSYAYGSFNTHRSNINGAFTSKDGFHVRINAFQNYSDNDYKVETDVADLSTGKLNKVQTVRRFHDQYHNETGILQVGVVNKKWADEFLAGITLGQYYKEMQTGALINAVYGAWHLRGNVAMPTLKYRKKDLFIKGLDVTLNANYNLGREQSVDTVHARYNWLGESRPMTGKGGELTYFHNIYRNNKASGAATATYRLGDRHFFAVNNVLNLFNRKGYDAVLPGSETNQIPRKADKNIVGLSYQYKGSEKWNATVFGKYLSQRAHTTVFVINPANPLDTIVKDGRLNRDKFGYGFASTYFIQPKTQVKLSYEKTTRLPEAEDLFGDMMNRIGNWDLKPERSDNINLGINHAISFAEHRVSAGVTGVYSYVKDYNYDVFDGYTNRLMADNVLKVSNLGLESEIRYSYGSLLSAGASATYQNLRDRERYRQDLGPDIQILSTTYGERIPNIPYFFGNADASLYLDNLLQQSDKFSISYNLLYVHSFYQFWATEGAAETRRTIPTQLAHDVNLVYSLAGGRYNIGLDVKNLTDRKLYDNFSLQKPGRSFNLKLRYFINQ